MPSNAASLSASEVVGNTEPLESWDCEALTVEGESGIMSAGLAWFSCASAGTGISETGTAGCRVGRVAEGCREERDGLGGICGGIKAAWE